MVKFDPFLKELPQLFMQSVYFFLGEVGKRGYIRISELLQHYAVALPTKCLRFVTLLRASPPLSRLS